MTTTVRFTSLPLLLKIIMVLFFFVSLFLLVKLVSTGSESRKCVYACGLFLSSLGFQENSTSPNAHGNGDSLWDVEEVDQA